MTPFVNEDDLSHFTRGRFAIDEQNEIDQHYVQFNVHELARLAAEAVGSRTCVTVR